MAQYPYPLRSFPRTLQGAWNRQGLPSSWHFSPRIPRSSWTPADPPEPHLYRSLCVGFWHVKTIAICFIRTNEAVSSFRECGLPYGLRGSLCTLQLLRSASFFSSTSYTVATLGMSGWLCLTQRGLSPHKKHQASLGARRGRDASYPAPPAQIPACGIPAPGSSEMLASAIKHSS